MGKSVLANECLLTNLQKIAKNTHFAVGLILGQPTLQKDIIIHFAKTPPVLEEPEGDNPKILKGIDDVNEEWIADHAKQVSRMLPGGMFVLGVFFVSTEDLVNPFSSKIRTILAKIFKILNSNYFLFGNFNSNDKIVLDYLVNAQSVCSKTYNIETGSVKPVEIKFQPNPLKWTQIECKFQIDQTYKVGDDETDWHLKKHMALILEEIHNKLISSTFMFDGEIKNGDSCLEDFGKKKKGSPNSKDLDKALQVVILEPCNVSVKDTGMQITDSNKQIKIIGQIVSKLCLNPKVNIGMATKAILQDIMRSLSSRLEMHWDSLTEEEHGEDINSVHEPPRRVLVALPNNRVVISDYLFPGEGAQEAQVSLEELFDIKIQQHTDIEDAEGQADLSDYYNEALLETESEETAIKSPNEKGEKYYLYGFITAIVICVLSLVIHFFQK